MSATNERAQSAHQLRQKRGTSRTCVVVAAPLDAASALGADVVVDADAANCDADDCDGGAPRRGSLYLRRSERDDVDRSERDATHSKRKATVSASISCFVVGAFFSRTSSLDCVDGGQTKHSQTAGGAPG